MYDLPKVVVVWVKDIRRVFRYTLVVTGKDAGMAYDVTMTPLDTRPNDSGVEGVELEIVEDRVELTQKIRTRLGLSVMNPKIAIQSVMWRAGGAAVGGVGKLLRRAGLPLPTIKGGTYRIEESWREYRKGHKKYTG